MEKDDTENRRTVHKKKKSRKQASEKEEKENKLIKEARAYGECLATRN
ncbi:hypothetical protein [Dubosiella newyorkensis]